MKNLIISFLFSQLIIPMYGQRICQDFESFPISTAQVNSIGNWVMYNSSSNATSPSRIAIQTGNGGKVISAADWSGSTFLINTQDYDGNWMANGNTCFCLDIKLISDGDNYPVPLQVAHGINIFQNLNTNGVWSSSNPQIRFSFSLTGTYNENSPWRRICLPIKLLSPGDPLPGNSDGQWFAGNIGSMTVQNAWNSIIQNVTEVGFFVDATGNNQNEIIGLDNICLGCEPNYCCPDLVNLITNFDFSNRRPPLGFNSQYVYYTGLPQLNSPMPGEFSIVNANDAGIVCPNWPPIRDHSTCLSNGTGNFMIVNGSTGNVGKKLVWEQTIPNLKGGREYKFCGQFKNMPQCCFDVLPKIDIVFSVPGFDLLNQVINVNSTANCGWIELSKLINIPPSTSLTSIKIQIWLDETPVGDGNDLAVDDLAFVELTSISNLFTAFSVSLPVHQGGTKYSFSFAANSLPSGCACAWKVCELDPITNQCKTIPNTTVYNDPQWWSLSNYCTSFNFSGYNGTSNLLPFSPSGIPYGLFDMSKTYRITRGAWCDCKGWGSTSYDLFEKNRALMVVDSNKQVIQKIPLNNIRLNGGEN